MVQSNGHFYVFSVFYNSLFYTYIYIRILYFSYFSIFSFLWFKGALNLLLTRQGWTVEVAYCGGWLWQRVVRSGPAMLDGSTAFNRYAPDKGADVALHSGAANVPQQKIVLHGFFLTGMEAISSATATFLASACLVTTHINYTMGLFTLMSKKTLSKFGIAKNLTTYQNFSRISYIVIKIWQQTKCSHFFGNFTKI